MVCVATENFTIEGDPQATIVVPREGDSQAINFRLAGGRRGQAGSWSTSARTAVPSARWTCRSRSSPAKEVTRRRPLPACRSIPHLTRQFPRVEATVHPPSARKTRIFHRNTTTARRCTPSTFSLRLLWTSAQRAPSRLTSHGGRPVRGGRGRKNTRLAKV